MTDLTISLFILLYIYNIIHQHVDSGITVFYQYCILFILESKWMFVADVVKFPSSIPEILSSVTLTFNL